MAPESVALVGFFLSVLAGLLLYYTGRYEQKLPALEYWALCGGAALLFVFGAMWISMALKI